MAVLSTMSALGSATIRTESANEERGEHLETDGGGRCPRQTVVHCKASLQKIKSIFVVILSIVPHDSCVTAKVKCSPALSFSFHSNTLSLYWHLRCPIVTFCSLVLIVHSTVRWKVAVFSMAIELWSSWASHEALQTVFVTECAYSRYLSDSELTSAGIAHRKPLMRPDDIGKQSFVKCALFEGLLKYVVPQTSATSLSRTVWRSVRPVRRSLPIMNGETS